VTLTGQIGEFSSQPADKASGDSRGTRQYLPAAPDRPSDGHKGTFGTVIVVGGSLTMPGAPAICGRAALRCGAGLVKLAADPRVLPTSLTIEPCATGIVLTAEDAFALRAQIDAADPKHAAVLAIGPGLSERSDLVIAATEAMPQPIVLDADGLNALARSGRTLRDAPGPRIITPHPGEYRRLAAALNIDADPVDPDQRLDAARLLAEAHGCIVLLKGANTIVTDGQRWFRNQTGNVALATAGSGDVLTGAIAALLAQRMQTFEAAALGAAIHGAAGDRWRNRHGSAGLRATDLADELPNVLEMVRTPR